MFMVWVFICSSRIAELIVLSLPLNLIAFKSELIDVRLIVFNHSSFSCVKGRVIRKSMRGGGRLLRAAGGENGLGSDFKSFFEEKGMVRSFRCCFRVFYQ